MQPTVEQDISYLQDHVTNDIRDFGADLSQQGQTMVQEQKKGLGKFGQFAVDLGSAATQMVLDIGFGVATGGGMALPAAIRTFGSSATEAAAEGADLDQQMLYATTSAAATYGIEQFCNVAYAGLKGIVPGVADDFVTDVVENLALKAVGDPAGVQALTNIGMLIASGAGEGVEETLESLLSPFLQQLSYNKNTETFLQNPKLLGNAAYEGLIGGIMGMFGSGTNTAIDLVANMIYDGTMPGEKLMADAGVGESEVLGAMAIHEMGRMEDAVALVQPDDAKMEYSKKQDEIKHLIQSDETIKSINVGHQNKHIKSSNGYTTGRSYIYGDVKEAHALVEKYHGTGRAVLTRKGEWTNKEMILAEDVIGVNVELETGIETETRRFTIHYGKKGTHIVPAKEIE